MAVRLPKTLFKGRLRTSTLLLFALFVALFMLYLEVRPVSGDDAPSRSTPQRPAATPSPSEPSSARNSPVTPSATPSRSVAPTPTRSVTSGSAEPSRPTPSDTEEPEPSATGSP